MKALVSPCLILCAILAASLWNGSEIAGFTRQCSEQLALADRLACEEQWTEAEARLQDSYNRWTSRQTFLHIVVRHDEIDNAEAMYHRARAFLLTRELSEFRAEVADLRSQLSLLAGMEEASIKNVL